MICKTWTINTPEQVYLLNYHLMWCLKRRRAILVGKIKHRLEQIIRETAKEMHVVLDHAVNPDHLHLLISPTHNSPYTR